MQRVLAGNNARQFLRVIILSFRQKNITERDFIITEAGAHRANPVRQSARIAPTAPTKIPYGNGNIQAAR